MDVDDENDELSYNTLQQEVRCRHMNREVDFRDDVMRRPIEVSVE